MKTPPVVSHRNEFRSSGELVEMYGQNLPDQFKHPKFREWLLYYTNMVIKSVCSNFGVAASRGIEQAGNLICDPAYYETKTRRRDRQTKAMREKQAQDEWERVQRIHCPTPEQIAEDVRWLDAQIKYHQTKMNEYEARKVRLQAKSPTTPFAEPRRVQ